MIGFWQSQERRSVRSRHCCAENDSVRNVWRPPIWTKKSSHLRPFRLCYVFYHRSDCCARNDSVRSVWRASFWFFCSDLGTPSRRPNRWCLAPDRISAFAVLIFHWASACGTFISWTLWSSVLRGDQCLRMCCYLGVWDRLLNCRAVVIAMALASRFLQIDVERLASANVRRFMCALERGARAQMLRRCRATRVYRISI